MPDQFCEKRLILDAATAWVGAPMPECVSGAVIVMFWSMTCPICVMDIARVRLLHERYAAKGLNLVFVHRPRFPSELNPLVVDDRLSFFKAAEFPCAVDNDHNIANRYGLPRVWPAYLLFNHAQELVAQFEGRGAAEQLDGALKALMEGDAK